MPGPMEQKTDEQLRKERLHFYPEEMSEINATLRGFLSRAKASSAFLVDKDGHLIPREGMDDRIDIAGRGLSNPGSMIEAIRLGLELARNRSRQGGAA